jgi:hypothetical protein
MSDERPKTGWLEARRAKQAVERERTGDSPEKTEEHHTPGPDVIDKMLHLGGVTRRTRFKKR